MQEILNNFLKDYVKNILLFKIKNLIIGLTHSGSAPIEGWIECISGDYTIGQAIHVRAINSHSHAEQHFRDNYVWHAWLNNNSENFLLTHDNRNILEGIVILERVSNKGYEQYPYNELSLSVMDKRPTFKIFRSI